MVCGSGVGGVHVCVHVCVCVRVGVRVCEHVRACVLGALNLTQPPCHPSTNAHLVPEQVSHAQAAAP